MPTKFWLSDTVSDINPGAEDERLGAMTQTTTGTSTATVASVLGPTAGIQLRRATTNCCWISPALGAVTISGTITFNMCGLESSMNANATFQVKIERCNNAGAVLSTICNSEGLTELGTSAAALSWTVTATNTTLVNGDRIKITVFANDATAVTMASGFTITLNYNGNTAGTNDSWIQFTQTVVVAAQVYSITPSGTLTPSGDLVKEVRKNVFTGALSGSGLLVNAKVKTIALVGTLVTAGALLRRTAKQLTGGTDPSINPLTVTNHYGAWIADDLVGADGSGITAWTDASGNGNNLSASGAQMALYNNVKNGHKVARSSGSSGIQINATTGIGTDDWTVMAALQGNNGAASNSAFFSAGATSWAPMLNYSNLVGARPSIFVGGYNNFLGIDHTAGDWVIITFYRRSGTVYCRRNGVVSGTTYGFGFSFGDGKMAIGGYDSGSNYSAMEGDLGELHLWTRSLSDVEIDGSEYNLQVKYGLRSPQTLLFTGLLGKRSFKSLAATVLPVAVLTKQLARSLDSTFLPTGATIINRIIVRAFTGILTTAGTLVKQARKIHISTFLPTGVLVKRYNDLIIATFAPTGTLSKRYNDVLTGTLSPSGILSKRYNDVLTSTLTSSGTLGKRYNQLLLSTLTPVATTAKQLSRSFLSTFAATAIIVTTKTVNLIPLVLTGTLTTAGTTVVLKLANVYPLLVAGTLTLAGALGKQSNKVVNGTLTTVGTLVKFMTRPLFASTLTTAGTLTKQLARSFTGTVASSSILSAIKTAGLYVLTLTGTLASAGTLVKRDVKLVQGTLTSTGVVTQRLSRVFTSTLTTASTLVALLQHAGILTVRSFTGTLTTSGLLTKTTYKTLVGTMQTASTLVRRIQKSLVGTMQSAGYITSFFLTRAFTSSLELTGRLSKVFPRAFGGVLGLAGNVLARFSHLTRPPMPPNSYPIPIEPWPKRTGRRLGRYLLRGFRNR